MKFNRLGWKTAACVLIAQSLTGCQTVKQVTDDISNAVQTGAEALHNTVSDAVAPKQPTVGDRPNAAVTSITDQEPYKFSLNDRRSGEINTELDQLYYKILQHQNSGEWKKLQIEAQKLTNYSKRRFNDAHISHDATGFANAITEHFDGDVDSVEQYLVPILQKRLVHSRQLQKKIMVRNTQDEVLLGNGFWHAMQELNYRGKFPLKDLQSPQSFECPKLSGGKQSSTASESLCEEGNMIAPSVTGSDQRLPGNSNGATVKDHLNSYQNFDHSLTIIAYALNSYRLGNREEADKSISAIFFQDALTLAASGQISSRDYIDHANLFKPLAKQSQASAHPLSEKLYRYYKSAQSYDNRAASDRSRALHSQISRDYGSDSKELFTFFYVATVTSNITGNFTDSEKYNSHMMRMTNSKELGGFQRKTAEQLNVHQELQKIVLSGASNSRISETQYKNSKSLLSKAYASCVEIGDEACGLVALTTIDSTIALMAGKNRTVDPRAQEVFDTQYNPRRSNFGAKRGVSLDTILDENLEINSGGKSQSDYDAEFKKLIDRLLA